MPAQGKSSCEYQPDSYGIQRLNILTIFMVLCVLKVECKAVQRLIKRLFNILVWGLFVFQRKKEKHMKVSKYWLFFVLPDNLEKIAFCLLVNA